MSPETLQLLDIPVELSRSGSGPPLLLLHGEDGFLFNRPLVEELSAHFSVIAPTHPTWTTSVPRQIKSLDDLAYLYLELLEGLDDPCTLVGISMGAWLAAEVLTKSQQQVSSAVLVAPIGIKTGGREDRAFVDIYASPIEDVLGALYSDRSRAPDLHSLSDDELLRLAVAQEAVARFGWEPYMHNPQLKGRLRRIKVPTLIVGGRDDRFVLEPNYFDRFADLVGDNTRRVVVDAGHRVDEELPIDLCRLITEFAAHAADEWAPAEDQKGDS